MDQAVILVSGGINSAVAAAVAHEQYEPALLHAAWGHRSAERERAAFEHLAGAWGIERAMTVDVTCMAAFGGNGRVSKRLPIEDASALSGQVPSTFAAGLIPTLIGLAAAWAAALKAKRIIVGISENHGTPGPAISQLYPDYRRDFLQACNLALQYAMPAKSELVVEAPLIDLHRSEVVRLGTRLKVPFAHTWSCYSGNQTPCGRCLGCATRLHGFLAAGVPDPLLLEPVGV